ncbi:hypothetical protein CRG98_001075 [Punica granatum]|uniref:Reverse transcriptase zinc-binding domain-containing protein n=1 Tax=Punica granatum TaxID=22663 RepID=A0A2I0LCW2_PUNGR|nr:hypothetical protein CRG98_001075 [Punica granatum]
MKVDQEASEDHILEIMRILDVFCCGSGQNVSSAKSVVHFSRNVADPIHSVICQRCSFTPMDELGIYLGIPIVHGKVVSLPRGIYAEINKLCRNFLWGHKEDQKKPHMLREGSRTRFWLDHWVPGCRPLLEQVVSVPSTAILHESVASFVTSSGGYDWLRILTYLNHTSLLRLASVLPPSSDTSGSDIPFWKLSPSGDYSVFSAYKLLTPASGLPSQSRL